MSRPIKGWRMVADAEGTPFGRYRLIELLGRGGMGEVWRAHDTATNRAVAIKVLPPHLAQDDMFVQRFRREAEAAARVNSPHIIPIHDYGEIDGRLFVNMRLVEGRDLQELLGDRPLEPGRAVRIIEQVAKALHAAHKIGLVHRDVKPSNILIDEDDFAYLIDFGIARGVDQTGLTGTGGVIGSWPYMSPERLRAGQVDVRSDIYALACVLYQCLTGSTPYPGDTFEQQMTAHLMEPPPRPSSTDPNMPVAFDPVIGTGMAKDPDQRYATTIELAAAAHSAITTPLAPPSQPTQLDDQPRPAPAPGLTLLADPTRSAPAPLAQQQPADVNLAATQQHQRPPPGRPPVPQPRPAHHPPLQPATPTRRWWRRQAVAIPAALLTAAIIAAAIVITNQQHTGTQHREPAGGRQVTLPFTGLKIPTGVAVDSAGNLYVAGISNNQVLKLAAGSATQEVLPFTGLAWPTGVAVDAAGNLYVTDSANKRVLKLAAGSSAQSVLPFAGLNEPRAVAVDTVGNLYVADVKNNRVLKLAAGSATQSVLPFTDLSDAEGVAVDGTGNLYVTDSANKRVLKLAAGSATQSVLPFTGLSAPNGVAVDSAGNLYVADRSNNQVLKLAAGSATQSVLPFTGLSAPNGVAVDSAGNLYVVDTANNRVVKLPAG
jgi:serine/threonine protein kinase, bacterial